MCVCCQQVKWAKLRGTPGSPPDKLAEAEREVNEAETRLRDTKIAYEVRAASEREGQGECSRQQQGWWAGCEPCSEGSAAVGLYQQPLMRLVPAATDDSLHC